MVEIRVVAAFLALALAAWAGPAGAQTAPAAPAAPQVDLALVMAVDNSASISGDDLAFQVHGHAAAFRDPSVLEALSQGGRHGMAATLVKWSGPGTLEVIVPWTVIAGKDDALRFADTIDKAPPGGMGGSTAIGSAVEDAIPLFKDYAGARRVIDVCSNGFSNAGPAPGEARDEAVAAGITVNALVILDDYAWLEEYFARDVIGGPGAFVRTAANRDSFVQALMGKLVTEIAGSSATRLAVAH